MESEDACSMCHNDQKCSACCRGAFTRSPRSAPRSRARLFRRAVPPREDRISSLPDELLLRILACLRCARAAAQTSVLSKRWRSVWTSLPEVTFHNTTPEQLGSALDQVTRTRRNLMLLDINVPRHHAFEATSAAWLLRKAASLVPEKLCVEIEVAFEADVFLMQYKADVVDLPCFNGTTVINLSMFGARFLLPPPGQRFLKLENLSLTIGQIDLAALLPLCPSLRKLSIFNSQLKWITVHSPLLEELDVTTFEKVQRIDILTPLLKRLQVSAIYGHDNELSLTCMAPAVEEVSWEYNRCSATHQFGVMRHLKSLKLKSSSESCQHRLFRNNNNNNNRVYALSLFVTAARRIFEDDAAWSFKQEMSRIPVPRFFYFKPGYHDDGARLWRNADVSTRALYLCTKA